MHKTSLKIIQESTGIQRPKISRLSENQRILMKMCIFERLTLYSIIIFLAGSKQMKIVIYEEMLWHINWFKGLRFKSGFSVVHMLMLVRHLNWAIIQYRISFCYLDDNNILIIPRKVCWLKYHQLSFSKSANHHRRLLLCNCLLLN